MTEKALKEYVDSLKKAVTLLEPKKVNDSGQN
jgi:hypothetical protein